MPSKTSWFDEEKTIIIHRIQGRWTIPEVLDEMLASVEPLETNKYQPQYYIIDLTDAGTLPGGILSYQSQYDGIVASDSITVFVSAGNLIKFFMEVLQRFGMEGDMLFVDTLEEAVELIEKHRSVEE